MDKRQEKNTKHPGHMSEHEKENLHDDSHWQEMADEHSKRHKPEHDMHDHKHSGQDKKMEEQAEQGHDHHEMMIQDFKKRFYISLVLTIPILIISPMIQHFLQLGDKLRFPGDSYLLFVLSSIVYFYGGWPFLTGFVSEVKKLQPGMMTLVAMAISVAYFYSSAVTFGLNGEIFFWELATLIDIMLLGHWLEMRSVLGASRALEELIKLMPSTAHKVSPDDGSTTDVAIEDLRHDDIVLIKPGEKVPVDGEVIDGETSINESMISGESSPVSKKKGDSVIGGSINAEGSVKVIVKKLGSETFLSQVVEMVRSAQESKSQTQTLADRAAMWLTIIALAGGAITLFIWTAVMNESFNFALTRTVTVMVIACPHALGLAIPLVVAVSTAISAKSGLLIRNRTAFESARKINAIIFDKTGTLTKGEFGVTDIILLSEDISKTEAIKYAASVEADSEHPIAQGIVKKSDSLYEVKQFNAIPGKGVVGKVNGHEIRVVSPGYLTENNITLNDNKISEVASEGKTVVYLIIDKKPSAAIALADIIRDESKEAIKELKRMGIKSIMLTGDNRKVAKWVSEELNMDEYFAEVLPDKKAEKIKEVQSRKLTVAMTGDGINDAPALAQADVGIAIGAGTDVAMESADVILVNSNPVDVVSLIKFSRATYKKMVQNLLWAAGYNIITIPLAAGVLYSMGILLDPAFGAVLMSLSTIIVAINSKLLQFNKR